MIIDKGEERGELATRSSALRRTITQQSGTA